MKFSRSQVQWLSGLLVAFVCAGVLSLFASSSPDGLEWVAEEHGFADTATEHLVESGPLAGYEVRGIQNEALSVGLAGISGTVVVLGAATALVHAVRNKEEKVSG